MNRLEVRATRGTIGESFPYLMRSAKPAVRSLSWCFAGANGVLQTVFGYVRSIYRSSSSGWLWGKLYRGAGVGNLGIEGGEWWPEVLARKSAFFYR